MIGEDKEVMLSIKCNIIIIIEKVIAFSRFFFFFPFLVRLFLGIRFYSSLISEFNEVLNAGASSIDYLPLLV
jgi:hypothetical protein